MKLFVTIVGSWKLLTSIAKSLDLSLENFDFQRTEEGCPNVTSLVVCMDSIDPFLVLLQTQNTIRILMKPFRNYLGTL